MDIHECPSMEMTLPTRLIRKVGGSAHGNQVASGLQNSRVGHLTNPNYPDTHTFSPCFSLYISENLNLPFKGHYATSTDIKLLNNVPFLGTRV